MVWSRFLGAGVVGVTAFVLAPAGGGHTAIYVVVAVAAVAAIWIGTQKNWTENKPAGALLATGMGLWALGQNAVDLVGSLLGVVLDPLILCALSLIGYAAVITGVLGITSAAHRAVGVGEIVESAIVAVGLGLISWVFVYGADPITRADTNTYVAFVYSGLDVFVLALIFYFFRHRRSRTFAFSTSALAMLTIAVGNYVSFLSSDQLAAQALWLSAYVLLGASALSAQTPLSLRRNPMDIASFNGPRLTLLTAAVVAAPAVMTVELARGIGVDEWGWAVASASAALAVLSAVRCYIIVRDLGRYAGAVHDISRTDDLTGLPNRRRLSERLGDQISALGDCDSLAVYVIDLDRFSHINETFGYAVGDRVLSVIADRLGPVDFGPVDFGSAGFSAAAFVSRLGGDEFVVVAPCVDRAGVLTAARALQNVIGEPISLGGIAVKMESTVGVAISENSPRSAPDTMLQRAHLAVTEAKRLQPRVAIYDRSMDVDRRDQLRLMSELSSAAVTGELRVVYQPLLDLETRQVFGLEALLRWQHPVDGLLGPDLFLPSAEQTGVLPAITAYVLDEALAHCGRWHREGLGVVVAINLSVRNLLDTTLPEQVRAALARHDVPATAIAFEITESSAMTDPIKAIDALDALRDIGTSISIDDYGTGYTSLAYLNSLPVQQLKIDRSFVTTMTTDSANLAIVRSTIDLARNLGVSVLAEGVEDCETLERLHTLGCDAAQGYHIARPVAADEVPALIASINAAARSREAARVL